MRGEARLCKLSLKSQSFDSVPGGVSGWSPAEVSLALAMLDPTPLARGLVLGRVFGIELQEYQDLILHAYLEAAQIAHEKHWRLTPGKELLRKVTELSVYEFTHPQSVVCKTCGGGGTEFVVEKGRRYIRKCTGCDGDKVHMESQQIIGNGKNRPSGRWYASKIGISETQWRRVWKHRKEHLDSAFKAIGGALLSGFVENFSEEGC